MLMPWFAHHATPPRPSVRAHHARGLMLFDLIAAMVIVGAIAVTFATVTMDQGAQTRRSSEKASAVARAERVLTRMQAGVASDAEASEGVTVTPVDHDSPAEGWRWVRVDASDGDASASLVGLVPADLFDDITAAGGELPSP